MAFQDDLPWFKYERSAKSGRWAWWSRVPSIPMLKDDFNTYIKSQLKTLICSYEGDPLFGHFLNLRVSGQVESWYQFALDSLSKIRYIKPASRGGRVQIFENLADSAQQQHSAEFKPDITRINGFNSLLTVLSNVTSAFVFNKSATPGWGLAEGTQAVGRKSGFANLDPSFAAKSGRSFRMTG